MTRPRRRLAISTLLVVLSTTIMAIAGPTPPAGAVLDGLGGNWYVSLSNGGTFNNYAQWRNGHGAGSHKQLLGDVNGDGRDDAVVVFTSGGLGGNWYVAASNGSGFNNYYQAGAGHGIGSNNQLLGDMNGDGRADAVVVFTSGGLGGNWYVALSNGPGFNNYYQAGAGHGVGSHNQLLGDVNGDRASDATVLFTWPPPAEGWRFAIADSSGGTAIPIALGDRFARLRPKTFRTLVPWNAAWVRPNGAAYVRARELFAAVRAQGVQQIVVTFYNTDFIQPVNKAEFKAAVGQFMADFDSMVDVWGPVNEANAVQPCKPRPPDPDPCGGGPQRAADYYNAVREILAERGSRDLLMSPEFLDFQSRNELLNYLIAYSAASGRFGHVIGWHPYHGLRAMGQVSPDRVTTEQFLGMVQQPQEVWITEVGAGGVWETVQEPGQQPKQRPRTPFTTEPHQNQLVYWLVNSPQSLLNNPRITRVYYYHMFDDGNSSEGANWNWDTGLVRNDGTTPRPAWRTWCAASHGGYSQHEDCRI